MFCGGVFGLYLFLANLQLNMLVIVGKKLSPKDRKFRWYKYDQEDLKRGENLSL